MTGSGFGLALPAWSHIIEVASIKPDVQWHRTGCAPLGRPLMPYPALATFTSHFPCRRIILSSEYSPTSCRIETVSTSPFAAMSLQHLDSAAVGLWWFFPPPASRPRHLLAAAPHMNTIHARESAVISPPQSSRHISLHERKKQSRDDAIPSASRPPSRHVASCK